MERSHRLGLSDECPECGHKMSNHFAWLREMTDVREYGDPDKVMVFSNCPMCGSRSWAHFYRETVVLAQENPDYINTVAPNPQTF